MLLAGRRHKSHGCKGASRRHQNTKRRDAAGFARQWKANDLGHEGLTYTVIVPRQGTEEAMVGEAMERAMALARKFIAKARECLATDLGSFVRA